MALRKMISRLPGVRPMYSAIRLAGPSGFLRSAGWWRSALLQQPVDARGGPLPWYCYSAIHFLESRIKPDFRVFEYGAGNSTLWWAERVKRVHSCEHDGAWVERLRPGQPANCILIHRNLDSGYIESAAETGPHDIIIIDGRLRNECARVAIQAITPEGVVIWDNSDRPRYADGFEVLSDAGFRRIDFFGLGPVGSAAWGTTIFYRSDNVLGI